jgi:hypothetical protein
MAVVRRKLTGRPFDAGDHEHIHHRLLERGLRPWQVLCIIGALCLTTGAAATAATVFRMDAIAWIIATTVIVLMIRLRLFGHHELGLVRGVLRRQMASFGRLIFDFQRPRISQPDDDLSRSLKPSDPIPEVHAVRVQPDDRRKAA